MMKRLTAICMVLLLMLTTTAFAADWEEGLGPSQPYSYLRKVDFSETIGYMMFHPNDKMSVAGAKTLFIYLPREDVTLNSAGGELVLRSTDQGEEFRASINNAERVNLRPMIESELDGLLWGSGVCVEITLPVSLRLGTTYFVDMDANCIVDEANEIGNPAFKSDNETHWRFETIGDYGVNQMEYRRPDGNDGYTTVTGKAQAGDEVRFDLVLGGAAKSATLYTLSTVDGAETIKFPPQVFTESCEIIAEVLGEDPAWGVLFWDDELPPIDPNEAMNHLVANLLF